MRTAIAIITGLVQAALLAQTAAERYEASAILAPAESAEAPAPDAGILRDLTVREGGRVAAEATIARIDSREQSLLAAVAQEDLSVATRESQSDVRVRVARAEQRVAEAELGRATSVNATLPNVVSEKEIDRLRLAVERTKLEIEFAEFERSLLSLKIARIEADVRLAKHRVDRRAVVTPIPGVVAEVLKRNGEWVEEGASVVRLVRVDRLRAEGYLPVEAAMSGLIGQSATVTAKLPSGETVTARGRVVFVSPEAEPVNAQVRFWTEIDNSAYLLRPGLTVRVEVLSGEAPDASLRSASQGNGGR
ncbi:MAG: efflux RND transporter periplasmic adaptor subunit [Lacipirellulaceae bacterium]